MKEKVAVVPLGFLMGRLGRSVGPVTERGSPG